jgi:methylase of polypeptide subunit release factors
VTGLWQKLARQKGLVLELMLNIFATSSATDVNPNACICTQETAEKNGVTVSSLNTNLV